jgi:hypothetical protein
VAPVPFPPHDAERRTSAVRTKRTRWHVKALGPYSGQFGQQGSNGIFWGAIDPRLAASLG